MNDLIVDNLYQFWTFIGKCTDTLEEGKGYMAVKVDSPWPQRVFNVEASAITKVIRLCKNGKLPPSITIAEDIEVKAANLFLEQRNMALELEGKEERYHHHAVIHEVQTVEEAQVFDKFCCLLCGVVIKPKDTGYVS